MDIYLPGSAGNAGANAQADTSTGTVLGTPLNSPPPLTSTPSSASTSWYLSPWTSNSQGSFAQTPTLTINGQAFTSSNPQDYITKLQGLQQQGVSGPTAQFIQQFQAAFPGSPVPTTTPAPVGQTVASTPNSPVITPASATTAPSTITKPSVAPPSVALQPGSTDTASVNALQDYLVANGYMTAAQKATGPGIYGPQTTAAVLALQQKLGVDNSSGPGYFGPKTLAAISAASTTPAVSTVGNVVNGSQISPVNPTQLPSAATGNAGQTFATSVTSISSTIASQKAALDAALAQQTAMFQHQIDALNQSKSDLATLSDTAMSGEAAVTAKETADKQAALEQEQQQYTDNYNASQALVDELDGLLTQGNDVVTQMQNTTGLSSIMTPRISKTMTDIASRAGVIQAVLSARSSQIGLAQNQLQTSLASITSIANDQINYYQGLLSYYKGTSDSDQSQINSLTNDQQTYIQAQITELQDTLHQTQQTATQISTAILDPNTALLYAKAGVTLSDSPAAVGQKLAVASYAQEISDTANKMAAAGYSSTPIAGVVPVTTTNSQGVSKNWYSDKVTAGSNGTVGTGSGNSAPGTGAIADGKLVTSQANIDSGKTMLNNSKTAPNAQGVAGDGKYADPSVYLNLYQAWISSGGTQKGFLAQYPYATYINPANTWLTASMTAINNGGASSGEQTP